MGYFFRPLFPKVDWVEHRAVYEALARTMDAPKNMFGLLPYDDRHFAHWRTWGWMVHSEHYKEFIEKLFIVIPDPTEPDLYEGDTIWRIRFNYETDPFTEVEEDKEKLVGPCFNHRYSDGFTFQEFSEAWTELIALAKSDESTDMDTPERIKDLKQSLKYIMFSKWREYEAY